MSPPKGEEGHILGILYLECRDIVDGPTNCAEDDRISCPEFFAPVCWGYSPLIHHEKVFFRVEKVSSHGLRVITSVHSKGLYRGLSIRLHVVLPMIGEYDIVAKVQQIRQNIKGNHYLLELEFVEPRREFMAALSQYLLEMNPSLSIAELKRRNFRVMKVGDSARITHPVSQADMAEILQLRLNAYTTSYLKGHETDDVSVVTDEYDSRGMHFMLRVGGELAAAGRLLLVKDLDLDCETVNKLGFQLPEYIRGKPFGEVTRAVLKAEYQGESDLFLHLLKTIFRIASEEGLQHLICVCTPTLVPLYNRLFFKEFAEPRDVVLFGVAKKVHALAADLSPENVAAAVAESDFMKRFFQDL
jgi:hypothetical protein